MINIFLQIKLWTEMQPEIVKGIVATMIPNFSALDILRVYIKSLKYDTHIIGILCINCNVDVWILRSVQNCDRQRAAALIF